MLYRPSPEHRRNVQGVLFPLTAAILDVFGHRAQDMGRPIGAFYPQNVSADIWEHLGGVWYRARDERKLETRRINETVRAAFARSILTGEEVALPSGTVVTWEAIPQLENMQLPPPLAIANLPGRHA